MKSFRTMLREEWGEYEGNGTHRVWRRAKIGPHDVNVLFTGTKGGQYSADFTVDHKVRAMDNKNPNGAKIVRHVDRTVQDFIKTHKPRSMTMIGSSDRHDQIYHGYRERLAKKFNGRHDPDYGEVFFNHGRAKEPA